MLSDPFPSLPPLWVTVRAGQNFQPLNAIYLLDHFCDRGGHEMLPLAAGQNEAAYICAVVLFLFRKPRTLDPKPGILVERKVLYELVARVEHVERRGHRSEVGNPSRIILVVWNRDYVALRDVDFAFLQRLMYHKYPLTCSKRVLVDK